MPRLTMLKSYNLEIIIFHMKEYLSKRQNLLPHLSSQATLDLLQNPWLVL